MKFIVQLILVPGMFMLSSCINTGEGVKQDSSDAGKAIGEAAEKSGKAINEAAE